MLQSTLFLALLLAAASASFLFPPKEEPNLKMGTLLSPEYDEEAVGEFFRPSV